MKFARPLAASIALVWRFEKSTLTYAFNANRISGRGAVKIPQLRLSLTDFFFLKKNSKNAIVDNDQSDSKNVLLNLLSKVPPNQSTSNELTEEILDAVSILEKECPTPEVDVLPSLAGNWELLWTAQDVTSLPNGQRNLFRTWINPLENQSYSNNPSGRSNPILPQNLQNSLEDVGVLSERSIDNIIKSTQAIDLKRKRIRNIVFFEANNPTPLFSKNGKTKGFITVDVKGSPNPDDARKIDVKFDRCSVTIDDSPIDVSFPLGIFGPTGWLRTVYVDDDIRITRGHKGSVLRTALCF